MPCIRGTIAMGLCLSVCVRLSQVDVLSKRLDESSWFLACELPSTRPKGKVFPYSLPSVGPGADPGVQAVSPQVT